MLIDKKYILLFLLLFLFSTNSSLARTSNWSAGIGAYNQMPGQLQTTVTGGTNTFSFRPYIFVQKRFSAFWRQDIIPELGFLYPQSSTYSQVRIYTLLLNCDFAYPLFSFLDLRYGPGILIQHLRGSGGTIDLNNAGSTSTFYLPGSYKTSAIFTANLGLEFFMSHAFSIRAESYWLKLFGGNPQWNLALATAYSF